MHSSTNQMGINNRYRQDKSPAQRCTARYGMPQAVVNYYVESQPTRVRAPQCANHFSRLPAVVNCACFAAPPPSNRHTRRRSGVNRQVTGCSKHRYPALPKLSAKRAAAGTTPADRAARRHKPEQSRPAVSYRPADKIQRIRALASRHSAAIIGQMAAILSLISHTDPARPHQTEPRFNLQTPGNPRTTFWPLHPAIASA